MKSWLRGKGTGLIAFLGIAALVIGGLGWATAAALRLEEGQHRADFEKEFNAQLSLVMWRLDSRVAPAMARENSRPYNHYNAVFAPAVLFRNNGAPLKAGQVLEPSPLLCAELPDWMSLHFQADAELGWQSPQVLSTSLVRFLENPKMHAPLDNVTPQRGRLLVDLTRSVPPAQMVGCVKNCNPQGTQVDTTLVPPSANPTAPQAQTTNPANAPFQQEANSNLNDSVNSKKLQSYQTNEQEAVNRGNVRERAQKDMQMNKAQIADLSWALANTARNGEGWFHIIPLLRPSPTKPPRSVSARWCRSGSRPPRRIPKPAAPSRNPVNPC